MSVPPVRPLANTGGYNFHQSMTVLHPRFRFGPRDYSQSLSVDQTLATLFDTLTVECSGVLVQPQWKHFRHIQMLKKDRIRLSNGIWRSWHLQCTGSLYRAAGHNASLIISVQKTRKPRYCVFDISTDLDHHKRQLAVVLEGKYWKRKTSAVATEYRKWRVFYHKKNKTRPEVGCLSEVRRRAKAVWEELQERTHQPQSMLIDPPKPTFLPNMTDFSTDQLFNLMDTSPSIGDSTMGIGLQQPNLDMLNPMLDDFLNSMDVVLPRSLVGVSYPTPQQPQDLTQPMATPTFGAPSTSTPSTYYTPPTHLTDYTPSQHHSMSPTTFLNIPVGDSGQAGFDMTNFPMKQEPMMGESRSTNQNSCMYSLPGYQQQGNPPQSYGSATGDVFSIQANIQHKVDDMEGAFGVTASQLLPPQASHHHTLTTSTQDTPFQSATFSQASPFTSPLNGGHITNPRDHMIEPSFPRVSSAGNLGILPSSPLPPTRPPLERGKSEPIQRLREQVQKLSAENEKQIREIDKQKNFAEKQYSELLRTVMQQASSGNASEQQKLALQSVLSNPSLVNILREVFLTTSGSGGGVQVPQDVGGAPSVKMSLSELHMKTGGGSMTSDLASPPNIVSPTDLAKVTGVSDFQSRLLVAAASQAAQSTSPTPLTPPHYNYLSGGSDSETTSTGLRIKPARKLSSDEKVAYKEMRRQSHISAEQKRRGSIKQGFDHLQSLVVNLSAYPSGKVSKAVILEKTIEHIQHSHVVRDERERKMQALRREIEELNTAIARCQEMLPASGVPVTRQRFEENRQRFREYVQRRTQQNYKFWIFSIILKQLFESYNSMVSTGSVDELCRTVLTWFEQNCALPALRPVVMDSLRELSQKTSILTDPAQVPRQLAQYAQQEMQLHRQEQEKARTNRFGSYS